MSTFYKFLIPCLLFFSCNNVHEQGRNIIEHSDSVAVNFFTGDGKIDSVTKVAMIKLKEDISLIENEATAATFNADKKCGYDGSLHFFKKNRVVLDIWFKKNDEKCNAFEYTYQGKLVHTKMGNKAIELLNGVQSKK
jgi:hypothetical protein